MDLKRSLWDCYVLRARETATARRRAERVASGRNGGKLAAWRRWRREEAIKERMAEVQRIAKRVRLMFTHHIPLEDLEQSGYLGLVSAANTYDPRVGAFPAYAYWRIRGEMIDSQKRRTFREAANLSLHGIAQEHDGWLPPELDTCPRPLQDVEVEREQIHSILQRAISALPELEQRVLRGNLAGHSLTRTAGEMGRSLTWTRAKLAEARDAVGVVVRGEK